jgi:hypothetical protein
MALDGISANSLNAIETTTTVENKAELKDAKKAQNSVFDGTAKEAPEAENAPEAKMMDEINNLKPSNFKGFLKGSGSMVFGTACLATDPLGTVFDYAKERHNQKKDIATLQSGVAGKTVYLSKKDYKKAVKSGDYDGNAVLISSQRFKEYVVENAEALGVAEIKTSRKK